MSDDPRSRWNDHYLRGQTPWDLGRAPPVLERLAGAVAPGRRVLVPGAGRGNDALAWAARGHRVTAVDLAPRAVEILRDRAAEAGVDLEVREGDVLDLPAALRGAFDLVWEQTCLCALPRARQGDYPASMAGALKPGGEVLALLWNHGNDGGPPFDLPAAPTRALFDGVFAEVRVEAVDDALRPGEYLLRARAA